MTWTHGPEPSHDNLPNIWYDAPMGKGMTSLRRPRTGRVAPPHAADAIKVLGRVKNRLAALAAGETLNPPSAEERDMLRWLQGELGLDEDMDRSPHTSAMYQILMKAAPNVLAGIQHPEEVLDGARYPLETGQVVALLQALRINVDDNGQRVRRLADAFNVPQLGALGQRVFFARHVLRIAVTYGGRMNDRSVHELIRLLSAQLTPVEAVVARSFEDLPPETEALVARATASAADVALSFTRR